MKRKIVTIEAEKCNGCGLCIGACAEGAIALRDGKAQLVSDIYCDGLGECLGSCPMGAITVTERDAAAFDPAAVEARLGRSKPDRPPTGPAAKTSPAGGCPGARAMDMAATGEAATGPAADQNARSALSQWPVQLHLVPERAPYWHEADLLLAADCTAVAYAPFHRELLKNRRLIIACPKLDDTSDYLRKLTAILRENAIRRLTVARMEVPCCSGLARLAEQALAASGKTIPMETVVIGIAGQRQGEPRQR